MRRCTISRADDLGHTGKVLGKPEEHRPLSCVDLPRAFPIGMPLNSSCYRRENGADRSWVAPPVSCPFDVAAHQDLRFIVYSSKSIAVGGRMATGSEIDTSCASVACQYPEGM
jgi:hypothetical protein